MKFLREEWKTITGYEKYEISNIGQVRVASTKQIRKPYKDKQGYKNITLYDSNKKYSVRFAIHKLVADAFIDNPNNYDSIDHIDFNRQNNRIDNLRWLPRVVNGGRRQNIKTKVSSNIRVYANSRYGNYEVKTRSIAGGYKINAIFRTLKQAQIFYKINKIGFENINNI